MHPPPHSIRETPPGLDIVTTILVTATTAAIAPVGVAMSRTTLITVIEVVVIEVAEPGSRRGFDWVRGRLLPLTDAAGTISMGAASSYPPRRPPRPFTIGWVLAVEGMMIAEVQPATAM